MGLKQASEAALPVAEEREPVEQEREPILSGCLGERTGVLTVGFPTELTPKPRHRFPSPTGLQASFHSWRFERLE